MSDSDMQRLGGLWVQESKSGLKYYSGKMLVEQLRELAKFAEEHNGECKFMLFQNKEKKSDNSPDLSLNYAPIKRKTQERVASSAPSDDNLPF